MQKQQKKEEKSTPEEVTPKQPSRFKGRFSISNYRQKMRETEKRERALETTRIKIITLIMTFTAMTLAFSVIPLFPQPLPLLLAVLVAFVVYQKPRIGMPVGSVLIGIGLIYHLSILNFIALLGDVPVRIVFVTVLMAMFVVIPIFFYRYRHAIAINFGILAGVVLFFTPIYFLAIPLILTSAVFFKKNAGLSALYYGLISSPLLIIGYWQSIQSIAQSDWWNAPGASPTIFTSLNSVYSSFQSSMPEFRLYEAQKFVNQITSQFTTFPDIIGKTIRQAVLQYRDSFPGILMFVVIIVGLILALILLANWFMKATNLSYGERIVNALTATLATALFFVFLGALQGPLAYTAKVDGTTTILATLATLAFTLPISLINYTPKKNATSDMITEKSNELMGKLQAFETQMDIVQASIPVNVSATEGKMLLIKDKLNDILNKAKNNFFDPSEIDKIYIDLDKVVRLEIDNLVSELNVVLSEFQIFVNTEYASWFGRLKDDVGLEFKPSIKPHYEADLPLEQRIQRIQEVLEAGRVLAVDTIEVVDPIYAITRALYDQSLPKDSEAIAFAKKKLDGKAPWLAIEALYKALNNWRKQYSAEIAKSTEYLKNSLIPIIDLPLRNDNLAAILGDKMPAIIADAKKAQLIKLASEKKLLNVLNLLTIQYLLDGVLDISKDVFSILNDSLQNQEKDILEMMPTSDYLWEKNATINERMTEALTVLSKPRSKVNEIMENLPKFEGYIDECIQTLILYNDRREFLLNYPMAKIVIEDQLKHKIRVTISDLPFETKYSAEYLRLYYLEKYTEFDFDKQNVWLTKKT